MAKSTDFLQFIYLTKCSIFENHRSSSLLLQKKSSCFNWIDIFGRYDYDISATSCGGASWNYDI